jgi:protein-disulfide isomerase
MKSGNARCLASGRATTRTSGWYPFPFPNPVPLVPLALIVAFAGLFAAGLLSLGHLLDLPVPCGRGSGCWRVAAHPSSKFLGIPNAYIGAAAYLTMILLLVQSSKLHWARISFFVLATFGTVTSAGLLIYSQSVIRATCRWCLVSGIAMTLLFILGILLLRFGPRLPAVRPFFPWGLAFLTAAALGVQAGLMQKTANTPPVPAARLAGMNAVDFVDPAKAMGPANAPVTIVVFADMWCPACRAVHESLHNYQKSNPAGVRLVFRHLPLWDIPGHEFSRAAAALSEMAGEKDGFWTFIDAVYSDRRFFRREDYLQLMGAMDFSPSEVETRLADPHDPAVARVLRDEQLAGKLGINATPTFILLVDGQHPISANQRTLPRLLNSPVVQSKLMAASALFGQDLQSTQNLSPGSDHDKSRLDNGF